jgi:hypothetical protein
MSGANSELAAVLVLRDEMSAPLAKVRAELDKVSGAFKGIQAQANQAMKPLAAVGEKTSAAVEKMTGGFARSERAQGVFIRSIGSMSTRLLSAGYAFDQLGRNMQGAFGSGMQTATQSLGSFVTMMAAMPTPMGAALAGVTAFATAFAGVSKEIAEIEERSKKLQAGLARNIGRANDANAQKDFVAAKMDAEGKTPDEIRIIQARAEQETRLLGIYEQQRRFQQELHLIEETRRNRGNLDAEKRVELLQKIAKAQELVNILSRQGMNADIGARMSLDKLKKELEDFDKAAKKTGERAVFLGGELSRLAGNEEEAREALEQFNAELENEEKLKAYYEDLEKLQGQFDLVGQKADAGLVTPLKAAEEKLEIIKKKMEVILAAGDRAPNGGVFLAQTEIERQGAEFEAGNLQAWEDQLKEDEKRKKKAQDDLAKASAAFRDQWVDLFDYIGQGFSDVFADAVVEGKSMTKGLGALFKDLQKSIIKMLMDSALGSMFRSAGGAFAGTVGAAFGFGGAPAQGQQQGSNVNVQNGNQAPGAPMFSMGGGNGWAAAGIGAGTAVGGYAMNRGISQGNVGMSTAGGALTGAMIGTAILPGIGTAVGALVGAAAGAWLGSEAKEEEAKMKERQHDLDEEAQRAHEAMVEKAKGLIKLHVRSSLGGGLATEEAMADVSKLFSNDISAEEVEQFGAENVVSRQAEIESQAGAQVTNNIAVTAHVGGQFDVQRLAESLGYFIRRSIPGA